MANSIKILIFVLLCIVVGTFVQCDCSGSDGPESRATTTNTDDDNDVNAACFDAIDYLYDTCFMEVSENRGYFDSICNVGDKVDWIFCIDEVADGALSCDEAIDLFIDCDEFL